MHFEFRHMYSVPLDSSKLSAKQIAQGTNSILHSSSIDTQSLQSSV